MRESGLKLYPAMPHIWLSKLEDGAELPEGSRDIGCEVSSLSSLSLDRGALKPERWRADLQITMEPRPLPHPAFEQPAEDEARLELLPALDATETPEGET